MLHTVPLQHGQSLCLVTTLTVQSDPASVFYRRCQDVEHNIVELRVTLDTERIGASSELMVKKQLLTSTDANNLLTNFAVRLRNRHIFRHTV